MSIYEIVPFSNRFYIWAEIYVHIYFNFLCGYISYVYIYYISVWVVSVDPSEAGYVSLLGEIKEVSTFNRGISCVIQCCHLVKSSFS